MKRWRLLALMPIEQAQKVKLTMHLPGGFSRVLVDSTVGVGLVGGVVHWEIPTDSIPPHLRKLGSRFIVLARSVGSKREADMMTPGEDFTGVYPWVGVELLLPEM
jgi:hypothetical protein